MEKIETIREYRDGGAWSLVGYTLVLSNGSRVPMQQPNMKSAQAPPSLESVTCDGNSIYTVKRQARDQLVVHRIAHSGAIRDALRITLPEVARWFPEGKWPMIWEIVPANGQLELSLVSYSYTATANPIEGEKGAGYFMNSGRYRTVNRQESTVCQRYILIPRGRLRQKREACFSLTGSTKKQEDDEKASN